MSDMLSYLDCGCAIMRDGRRSWCPTCASASTKGPDLLDAEADRRRRTQELLEALAYDGCWTGDCPHERIQDCFDSISNYGAEALAILTDPYPDERAPAASGGTQGGPRE